MVAAREGWRRWQPGLDPAKLVFIDESGAKTNMTRLRGRAPRGERLHACAPCGRWESTTMISSVRLDGSTACMTVGGATNTEVFHAYVGEVLLPTLGEGDIVVMDNLSAHKNARTIALVESAGARVAFLPPYSPDLNPIERIWLVMKARWFNNHVCRDRQALIERLDKAILDVIADPKSAQHTASMRTLF